MGARDFAELAGLDTTGRLPGRGGGGGGGGTAFGPASSALELVAFMPPAHTVTCTFATVR